MVAYSFSAQQFEPKYSGGGGLPVGKYKGRIVDTRTEANSKGDGGFLALDLTPIEGPLIGVIQVDRLNLHHTNPKVVEIANKQLSAYCHVTNQFVIQDTAQLHNIPFMFEIGPQKNNPEYTQVIGIWDINGNEPGKGGGQAAQQAPAQPFAPPAAQQAQPPPQQWGGTPPQAQAQPPQQQWGAPPAQQQAPPAQQAPTVQGWGGQTQPAGPAPTSWTNR